METLPAAWSRRAIVVIVFWNVHACLRRFLRVAGRHVFPSLRPRVGWVMTTRTEPRSDSRSWKLVPRPATNAFLVSRSAEIVGAAVSAATPPPPGGVAAVPPGGGPGDAGGDGR